VDEFRAICDEHQLALIEDVSHAPSASCQGQPVGSFGDFSFCSFQARKLIAGGEGGVLLTDDSDLYYRVMELGHPRRLFRAPEQWRELAGVGRGFKFRPSPILIALASDSLQQLPAQVAIRRRACGRLRKRLESTGIFEHLDEAGEDRVFYCCELVLSTKFSAPMRDQAVHALQSIGLPVDYLYAFLPDHPAVTPHLNPGGQWPESRNVLQRILLMHAYTAYSEDVIDRHASIISELLSELQNAST
jgi:dTDP-4-amino-4,6-dideoxygalactose transaminase